MTEENQTARKVVLQGEDALRLWRQGKRTWNSWVKENPVADIDFSDIDFGKVRSEKNDKIDFGGFIFPKGKASFYNAQFGEGEVNFADTRFNKGIVDFSYATFGTGNISFSRAAFGDGEVNFIYCNFGKGNVYFANTAFGNENVNFMGASFGEGDVYFDSATFGDGNVSFENATFGKGNINFRDTNFGQGDVEFGHAQFGDGDVDFGLAKFSGRIVDFSEAQFGKGNVNFTITYFTNEFTSFYSTNFGSGNVYFTKAQFDAKFVNFNHVQCGEGEWSFVETIFKGHVSLMAMKECHLIENFSFKASTFEKALDLSHNHFSCVVDLTSTKLNHHVELDGFECEVKYEPYKQLFKKAKDTKDIARLRRLKEIAENNKDHRRGMEFHAQEMRAMRWHVNTAFNGLTLDYLFDWCSDYGRSETRPLICLLILWQLFGAIYFALSNNSLINVWQKIGAALSFSASQIVPIAPGSKTAQLQSLQMLFFNKMNLDLYIVTLLQSVLSIVMLFLIGLALRNRFRI